MPPFDRARARRILQLALPCAAIAVVLLTLTRSTAQAPASFGAQIAGLSEPGGYFDTDNLISNERSYLQVLPELRAAKLRGGAYIGVGPDTNFTYIAAARPEIAFIVDIRRDNLLLHLLFKALFELSGTRVEFLAHLLGRAVPSAVESWRGAPIERIVAHIDRPALNGPAIQSLRRRVDASIARMGVGLSAEDRATIERYHTRFIESGLELRFHSIGRPPQYHYPTYRELLLETDPDGIHGHYLASEESFDFVKRLQSRDLVIPVVGNLSGPSALGAIGRLLASRNERLTVFYTSNVEFYLYGQGAFPRFVSNLKLIPRTKNSVIVRSVFGRYSTRSRPGNGSTSHLHGIEELVAGTANGRFRSYGDLVSRPF